MGNLSDAMQSMVNDIRSATESRRAAFRQLMEDIGVRLSEIRSDTHNLMERFRREDNERKTATGEMLGDFRRADDERKGAVSELKASTDEMVEELHNAVNDLKGAVSEMVEGFHREDNERKGAVGEMLGDFRRADDERKGAVGEMLGDFGSDRRQAHQIWTQRLKGKIKPEPVRKIKPEAVVEEVKEKPKVEAAPFDEEKVLELISRYPEGIRLIDIGNELGVDWRILIGPSKSLVDAGRVEKIENMYYPKKEE